MKRKVLTAFGLLSVLVAVLFCLGLPGSKAQAKTYQIGTDVTYPHLNLPTSRINMLVLISTL